RARCRATPRAGARGADRLGSDRRRWARLAAWCAGGLLGRRLAMGGRPQLDVGVQALEALRHDRARRCLEQPLADAGDLAADLRVGVVEHARGLARRLELDRRGRLDEARRAATVDDHRVAHRLDLVLEIDLAGEVALDRPDLDLDLADVVAVDELELLAPRHDGGQDHRIEQRAPHLVDGGLEQIVTCELHRGTSAPAGARAWGDRALLREPAPPPLRRGSRPRRCASAASDARSWTGRKSST